MRTATFLAAVLVLGMPPLAAWQASGTDQAAGSAQGGQGGRGQRQPRDPSQMPAQGTSVIAGRVVSADSGRPIKRAVIFVSAGGRGGRSTLTDEQGTYQITGLQAGSYTVTASKTGFVDAIYGQRRPLQPGVPVTLGDAQQIGNVDLRVLRGGVIAGRVLDEDGEPLARATVTVQRHQYVRGERQLSAVGSGQTDDRGQYRLFGLPPGDYFISASVNDALTRTLGQLAAGGGFNGRGGRGGPFGPAADPEPSGYAPTYYPGVPAAADATKITIAPSQELTSIDFQVQLVPLATIKGTVVGGEGPGQVSMIPQDVGGVMMGGLMLRGRALDNGSFVVSNVPPGRYTVIAQAGGRGDEPRTAVQTLRVTGENINGLVLTLLPGVSVSGNVTVESSGTPAPTDYSTIRIEVPESDPLPSGPGGPGGRGGGNGGARAEKNGAFEVDGLLPGGHYLRVTAPTPWAVKSVTVGGRDAANLPFELKPGQNVGDVSVVLTDRATTLAGTVRDNSGAGVAAMTVIAFSTDEQYWGPQSRMIQAARTTQTGAFQMRGLPPGAYYLLAVDDAQQGEWFDPAYLTAAKAAAVRVSLSEGESTTQDLKGPA